MARFRAMFFAGATLTLLMLSVSSQAQSFAPVGNLDCNGYSAIQKPLRPQQVCADYHNEYRRGYDNSHYIGHDEPSIGFISTAHHSGNNVQWEFTLPRERPLPATQTFENTIAIWFAMSLCEPTSGFVPGPCIPNSDENNPFTAGDAFMELQLYPPGWPPFITQISCDAQHWCAALNIDSLKLMKNGNLNPNCTEPVNFAFIQTNGVPTGPPGPTSATNATFTPNAQTLLMNQGDHIRLTIKDTPAGLITRIDDMTTGRSGFMVASGANGFQSLDPNTCAPTSFDFHPEYDTAKFGNFVEWAALQANINLAVEIGHFEIPNNDSDDPPCFPGPNIAGCIGADLDFDGTSYQFDWPDGTRNHATSIAIHSVEGGGIGPMSPTDDTGDYDRPFPIFQLETDVPASETTCQPNGVGCVVPPVGAQFYPFYAIAMNGNDDNEGDDRGNCALLFGNFSGPNILDFRRDEQYGASNLYWFFGTNSGGPRANPCIPHPDRQD